jgi:hypothetical protein
LQPQLPVVSGGVGPGVGCHNFARFSDIPGILYNRNYLCYLAVLGRWWVARIPTGAHTLQRFSDGQGATCNRNCLIVSGGVGPAVGCEDPRSASERGFLRRFSSPARLLSGDFVRHNSSHARLLSGDLCKTLFKPRAASERGCFDAFKAPLGF